jgi:hypothetical protein
MRTLINLLAVTALSIFSPIPKLHAQALSPDNGIDDVEVVTVTAVVDKVDLEKRKGHAHPR